MALKQATLLSLFGPALCLCLVARASGQAPVPESAPAPQLAPAPPQAQSVEQELARTMFETAVEKSARGEWNDALDLLVRSRALVDRPVTAMNQALVLARMSRMREALRVLAEARALTRSPEDDELIQRIEQLRAEIAPLVGELSVHVQPASALLSVDGAEQRAAPEARYVVALDPGPHHVEAKATGYSSTVLDLQIARGERRTLELVLTPLPTLPSTQPVAAPRTVPPPVEVSASDSDPPRPLWRSARLWGPVGAVVVGAVVLGLVLGLRSDDDGSQRPDGGTSGRVLSPP